MAIRKILIWPNPTLTKVSEPVVDLKSEETKRLVIDLIDTMRANVGVGLAAIQIGVPLRVFVMERPGHGPASVHVCINPVMQDRAFQKLDDESNLVAEGCLSLPGVYENVRRFVEVVVDFSYVTEGLVGDGIEPIVIEGRYSMYGLEAQIVAHEMEHLDGKIFVDNVGRVRKDLIKRKIAKTLRERSFKNVHS